MPGFCYSSRVLVHTLGHSTRSAADFVASAGRTASGRGRRGASPPRHLHFAEALADALAEAGIAYLWLPAWRTRRGRPDSPHVGWRTPGFRAYADHMETAEFRDELARLEALARERPAAIMCAEAVPWRCHRQLIADALVARGHEVRHITGPAAPEPHRLTPFARLVGDRLVYDGGQMALR
jgi:uncharacterized protein (DUF488 family)